MIYTPSSFFLQRAFRRTLQDRVRPTSSPDGGGGGSISPYGMIIITHSRRLRRRRRWSVAFLVHVG